MEINYSEKQEKIYTAYSVKPDQELRHILQNPNEYNDDVIAIVFDILKERGYSKEVMLDNIKQAKEEELLYTFAAESLFKREMDQEETVRLLVEKGVGQGKAEHIVNDILVYTKKENEKSGNRDMLYGAIWLIGGVLATAADFGFIFWGAIVFGAIQFIRGASA
ncbi:MAG: hypothetical protein CVT94_16435 [Bacteroidetes bacterium HGW-Bacteroidetes-11]|nr:MAG: hypothetical protein CVT94_16435 [Bacteroidetes bacterium HGW-Bacteroidetes-11]